jgi:hypothetical protein
MATIDNIVVDSTDAGNLTENITRINSEIGRDGVASNALADSNTVVARTPIAPHAPVVAGGLAAGPQLTFLEFLRDEECQRYCRGMFGESGSSAATMLTEFRLGTEFHYFGPCSARPGRNAGKLDKLNSATKEMLKAFARGAYRGDREKRGVPYWQRIATQIWHAYAHLMAMREQTARISAQDRRRSALMPQKRAAAAARARRSRAKRSVARSSERTSVFKQRAIHSELLVSTQEALPEGTTTS